MTDYSELKSAAEASIKAWDQHFQADSHEFYEAWCEAEEAFSMAAREEVVLAMIAENETLRTALKVAESAMWKAESNMDNEAADIRDLLKSLSKEPSNG